jgi:hypothetical protein
MKMCNCNTCGNFFDYILFFAAGIFAGIAQMIFIYNIADIKYRYFCSDKNHSINNITWKKYAVKRNMAVVWP